MAQPHPSTSSGHREGAERTVFTVGHSNGALEGFIALLQQFEIEVLVDTRSQPYSRYASQFNAATLERALEETGIRYCYLGDSLGGRPRGDEFYGSKGEVLYDRLAEHPFYQEGVELLLDELSRYRVCLLCSEEDPTHCHRRLLIGRTLLSFGLDVNHIRGDGTLETEEEVARRETPQQQRRSLQEHLL